MKLEAIKALREHIASSPPEAFRMETWLSPTEHPCGTAGCLAGHAVLMAGKKMSDFYDEDGCLNHDGPYVEDVARCILGISTQEADFMFLGEWSEDGAGASRDEALKYLDKVIKTGKVSVCTSRSLRPGR